MTTVYDAEGGHDAPERVSVPERLVQLSRRYAAEGDLRRAQLASWAADVYLLEELLWENGLAEAPDPVAQLAVVGESVATALEGLADGVTGEVLPRAVLEAARRAMVSTFDASVHEVLLAQLPSLDHLDSVRTSSADHVVDPTAQRLEGRSSAELVGELRQAAADCVRVREVMDEEGEATAADRMAHQADVATFEAYLVAAAVHAGDEHLASVDLRWELARELQPETWATSDRSRSPFATLRRELISLVGSAEMETLWRTFESQDEIA